MPAWAWLVGTGRDHDAVFALDGEGGLAGGGPD